MLDIKVRRVLISLIVALLIMFGGNYLINNYKLNYSLNEDLLRVAGVKQVIIRKENDIYNIVISLNKVNNLKEVFTKINNRVEKTLDKNEYNLDFSSGSSEELKQIYDRINLPLYEALETGEFVQLGERIDRYGREYDLNREKVMVDDNYVYLSLEKNNNGLYKVIKRNNTNKSGGDING